MFLWLDQQLPNIYTCTSLKFARVCKVNLCTETKCYCIAILSKINLISHVSTCSSSMDSSWILLKFQVRVEKNKYNQRIKYVLGTLSPAQTGQIKGILFSYILTVKHCGLPVAFDPSEARILLNLTRLKHLSCKSYRLKINSMLFAIVSWKAWTDFSSGWLLSFWSGFPTLDGKPLYWNL